MALKSSGESSAAFVSCLWIVEIAPIESKSAKGFDLLGLRGAD
jgi:hypothetical protein